MPNIRLVRVSIDNIFELKTNSMTEEQRTELLNYLNDNNIKYDFDRNTQEITINLTVK